VNHIGRRVIDYLDSVSDVIDSAIVNKHLNLIRTDQTSLIDLYTESALNKCSNYLGYEIRRATVDYYFEIPAVPIYTIGHSGIELRIPANVIGVDSVNYRNESDVSTAMSASDYSYYSSGKHIPYVSIINTQTISNYDWAYKVRVTEGFYVRDLLNGSSSADETDILPVDILNAILLEITHVYENRNNVNIVQTYELCRGAESLLFPYKKLVLI
jgi:hypothetical protein